MAQPIELTVSGAGEHQYPVIIGEGLLEDALPAFVEARGFKHAAVITNTTVAPLYGESLCEYLPCPELIVVPDGEAHKRIETVQQMYDGLLKQGADRSTLVVALGGGVMTDMAGFAAATFMRGVPLVQVPTTLLAMVDASIGGKAGVDLPQGKNLAGAFKDPLAVFADTATLGTLPAVERECGMAEIIKAGIIGSPALFEQLGSGVPPTDAQMIAEAARVKIDIVQQDRLEGGLRAVLNLGHTFAHAIEQVSGYRWKHGQAVGFGLVAAARLSERLGLASDGLSAGVERVVERWGLPTRISGFAFDALWEAMQHDKKWKNGQSYFILLEGIGQPLIRRDVAPEDVQAVLAELEEEAV